MPFMRAPNCATGPHCRGTSIVAAPRVESSIGPQRLECADNRSARTLEFHQECIMLKWKVAALVGLGLGIAGVGWGFAQQRNEPGFYELRVYTAQPGRRDALAARFAGRTAAIY